MTGQTLAQSVRALAADLRRQTSESIAAGRGIPRFDGAWIAGHLEQLLSAQPPTPDAAQVLRDAADDLESVALGRGCAPEYAAWLRVRADRIGRA